MKTEYNKQGVKQGQIVHISHNGSGKYDPNVKYIVGGFMCGDRRGLGKARVLGQSWDKAFVITLNNCYPTREDKLDNI